MIQSLIIGLLSFCLILGQYGPVHSIISNDTPPTASPSTIRTSAPTAPLIMYGALSNFDCYCTTGEDCHGFDIELEGISCASAPYIFTSNRYGVPEKVDSGSRCIVRYRASYDNSTGMYSETTRVAVSPITPTGGHSCFVGGMAADVYNASGCEHFGVSLSGAAPTATRYYWLVKDKINLGGLVRANTRVAIPAVSWNVNPNPVVGANPVVQAVVPIQDFEDVVQPCELYGDAKWVKVFVTEIETEIELDHLVANNALVPQTSSETEIEWQILQRQPTCGENGQPPEANELGLEQPIADGSRSIIRRYEFYEYTGEFDPENHEVLPISESDPAESDIGDYLGSQMAALVLDAALTVSPTASPTAQPSSAPTPVPTSSMAPTLTHLYETLNSFDCFCTGSQDCHGFEIEVQDVPCNAVFDVFSDNRYGSPDLIPTGWSCLIRYSSDYDDILGMYTETTLAVGTAGPIPFIGKSCYAEAMSSQQYDSSGCEHFGVALHGAYSPSGVSLYWLVDDSFNHGQLLRSDTFVPVPFVSWTVDPFLGPIEFVNASINGDDTLDCSKYGDAKLVKVYSSQVDQLLELKDMVLNDSVVPNSTNQIEVNWGILQRKPTCGESAQNPDLNVLNLGSSRGYCAQSIIRHYEFYEFNGTYDPEHNEAIFEPDFLSTYFGNYLGSQVSAIVFDGDLAPTCAPSQVPTKKPVVPKPSKPTRKPTKIQTSRPSKPRTAFPSFKRSKKPTVRPTLPKPSSLPTRIPSRKPSSKPSARPTRKPSVRQTKKPSAKTSARPTKKPSAKPSNRPTKKPTVRPSKKPSSKPSARPSQKPSAKPSARPSRKPSVRPTRRPTPVPSRKPTDSSTIKPTSRPSTTKTNSPTAPLTFFGALSNFDCFCTTGEDCHGFDIELEGITCTNALYTFSSNRYGTPEKVDSGSSCIVRYRASYDNSTGLYSQTTRAAVSPITPTGGHSCFVGGMTTAVYNTSGCEHFGVSLSGAVSPTATKYYWLVADKVNLGGLVRANTKVAIPPVAWNVNPNPVAGGNPIVQALVPIQDFEDVVQPCQFFGDAKWVKVFVTEIETEIELDDLVANNPLVPQTSNETEIEWQLLQRQPTCGENGQPPEANELELNQTQGVGARSVIRRYEFYEYTGAFDPENHEVLPISESNPAESDVGDYLGSQMAALIFDAVVTAPPTSRPSSGKPTSVPTSYLATFSPSGLVTASPSVSPSTSNFYGALSNFDCYCTTGEDCHGFDIELEGITCFDAPYTFSSNRYGTPDMIDTNSSCIVRYRASYYNSTGVYSETTRVPVGPIVPTEGHSCFVGGMAADVYNASGCEHFGVSLSGTVSPTSTRYYWLVADKVNLGGLVRANTKVAIPPVTWNVNPNPVAGGNPIVQAVVPIQDFEDVVQPCELFGDAQWVKVFVTETETEIELDDLVANNPLVPQTSSETEIEWQLLQRQPTCGENGQPPEANELGLEQPIADGSRSVIRRYEFYEYTGAYDPENHEALNGNRRLSASDSNPKRMTNVSPDVIGDYLGSQMAALVLAPVVSSAPTVQSTATPTVQTTVQPSAHPSASPTAQPTASPTATPSVQPTDSPTAQPSAAPTANPTLRPTLKPSVKPSARPTRKPSLKPTIRPSKKPSARPTRKPSLRPSKKPLARPTRKPSRQPSFRPSKKTSARPTKKPSRRPSPRPSKKPSGRPSRKPSRRPSLRPTKKPSRRPSPRPSKKPSGRPSRKPSRRPSLRPTKKPSRRPSPRPSKKPLGRPSRKPSRKPSLRPSKKPSSRPSKKPTKAPTRKPTRRPSKRPTNKPVKRPTSKPSTKPKPA